MLTLNDGRSELWQWDTGRTLVVDADCSQVHFSNKVFGRSIDVDVVDGVAIIPDILLQTDKELTAWAFVGTAENGYTKISKVFKVNKRNKPADYVFTPTDQNTLGDILDRIEDLENRPSGDVSEEDIQNAVNDYLDKNPVSVEEKDPTVPDWAKQPQKPTYTAAEVGALPDTTKIPSTAEDVGALPANAFIPKSATDVGAIPVPETATVGQTIVVKAVDESGKPTEWECVDLPSGGGGEIDISREPDLVLEVSEAVTSLSISDIDGEPIDTTEMVVLWEHPGGAQYFPNYFRFNNAIKNSTIADSIIANFNLQAEVCPSEKYSAAILARVKKINNGTYWQEYSGLQQNAGTITGVINKVMGGPYRNILIGETSIKEFFVYQSSNIQEGCKVSVWVK